MEKTYKPLSELHGWDKNPRSIKGPDFERLKKQVELLGQYKPLLITPDGTVLGGNMRIRAYRELGINDVWVSVIDFQQKEDGLWYAIVNGVEAPKRFQTKEDAMMEYSLSDNDRAGFYDEDLLANVMSDFNIDWGDYAVDLTSPISLQQLIDGQDPDVKEDEAPEVDEQNPAVSQLGEVYQLGRHRVMCGDATKIEDVDRLMNGQRVDIVFTDPPYGMSAVSNSGVLKETYKTDILNDGNTDVAVGAYNLCITMGIPKLIFWGANYYANILPPSACWFVWDKNNGGSDQMDCELAWTNLKGVTRQFTQSSEKTNRVHPTQKPVSLCAWSIKPNTADNSNVLDLFGGSGSTLMACEQINRTSYIMELDPRFCDVIRKRYAKSIDKENEWQENTPVTQ